MEEGKTRGNIKGSPTGRLRPIKPPPSMRFPLKGVLLAQYLVQSNWAELEIRTMMYLITEFCRHKGLDVNKVILGDEIMWPSAALHGEFKEFCNALTQRVTAFTKL